MKKQLMVAIAASLISLSAINIMADETQHKKGLVKCYGITSRDYTTPVNVDGSIMISKRKCKKMGGSLEPSSTAPNTVAPTTH